MNKKRTTAGLLMIFLLSPLSSYGADVAQKTFATPQEAVDAAVQAAQSNDTGALLALFGPESRDIVISGDPSDDKDGRARFVKAAHEKTNLIPAPMDPDKTILSLGEQDWPFPIPLVRKDGKWYFDSSQGKMEILARRIGSNEMSAIEICRGYVEAQFEYAQAHRQKDVPEYAQKIMSSKGKQDGLYWESKKGQPECVIPKGFAAAALGMVPHREPYHGYYFKILTAQGSAATGGAVNYVVNGSMLGGFALVAWPAEYGVSGIQTFMVSHDGTVYEKHLGPDGASLAEQMTEYNPDASWRPVQSE